ncbi:reverse transcriptase domain-containing protein [Tanacetum coccineum]
MVHQQAYQAPPVQQQSPTVFLQLDSGLVVPSFLHTDDLISGLNNAKALISIAFASRYPPMKNQLRCLSNPRNQATFQDGRVTVQNVQGRQNQGYAGSGAKGNATGTGANRNIGTNTVKVIRCYNCRGEGHMAIQCTQPKRPKNSECLRKRCC